jgi:hypothetical protein
MVGRRKVALLAIAACAVAMTSTSALGQPGGWGAPGNAQSAGLAGGNPPPPCTPNLNDLAKNASAILQISQAMAADVTNLQQKEQVYSVTEAVALNLKAKAQNALNAAYKSSQPGSAQWTAEMKAAVIDEQASSIQFGIANNLAAQVQAERNIAQRDQLALDNLIGCPQPA